MEIKKISDEGLRVLSNLAQHYDAWIEAERAVSPGRLAWKTVDERDYLYRITDSRGNGKSLGRRDASTEAQFEAFQLARETSERAWASCERDGAIYRALRLPRIASYAAEVLREVDTAGLLGSDGVLVIGTNAMAAYAIEAAVTLPPTIDATEDFDLTWVREESGDPFEPTVFESLKRADSTFTINAERTFQARNADGHEVELLLPESLDGALPKHERFRPIPLPEQDWLLPGQRVEHIVCGFDATPARIVAPDPRWFALHKLWLSEKPTRNPLKKTKDALQGMLLLDMVLDHMPRFVIDGEFRAELPEPLKPYLDRWYATRAAPDGTPRRTR